MYMFSERVEDNEYEKVPYPTWRKLKEISKDRFDSIINLINMFYNNWW